MSQFVLNYLELNLTSEVFSKISRSMYFFATAKIWIMFRAVLSMTSYLTVFPPPYSSLNRSQSRVIHKTRCNIGGCDLTTMCGVGVLAYVVCIRSAHTSLARWWINNVVSNWQATTTLPPAKTNPVVAAHLENTNTTGGALFACLAANTLQVVPVCLCWDNFGQAGGIGGQKLRIRKILLNSKVSIAQLICFTIKR